MSRLAIAATRFVGRHWGEVFPFYYVMEFPKSGGSWLADMIADYLRIPNARNPVFPIGFQAVIHGHWKYSPRYKRVFYLYRDGRDVAVSTYFRMVREYRRPNVPSEPAYFRKRYPRLFASGVDLDEVRIALPLFLEDWARTPGGVRANWSEHIGQWLDGPNVVALSYEDLLSDTAGTLGRVVPEHTGEPPDRARLEATAFKYSFEQLTGRKAGSETRGAIIRKGVAGDWVNHFTSHAGEIFDRHFGDMLVRLAYVEHRDWFGGLPRE
jgi:hypothetical protein